MEVLALLVIVGLAIWLYRLALVKYIFDNLHYRCAFSVSKVFEGDEVFFKETVHNNKFIPVQWLKAEIHTKKWLDFANTRSTIAQDSRFVTSGFSMGSYQKTTRTWNVKCTRRGVYNIENVTLAGGDFLGMTTYSVAVSVGAVLTVYPAMINIEDMFVSAKKLQGEYIVRRWILDDPFVQSGAREYTPGDPMNRIHWSATAKQGSLMVIKNEFTSQYSMRIILNIQSMEYEYMKTVDRDLIELGIKAAATLLDRALSAGISVGIASNGCTCDAGNETVFTAMASGRQHVTELLGVLARLELIKVREFEDYIEDIYSLIENGEVIIITSYLSDSLCITIDKLKRQQNQVRIILLSTGFTGCGLGDDTDIYVLS